MAHQAGAQKSSEASYEAEPVPLNNKEEKASPQAIHPWKRIDIILSTVCLNLFAIVLPVVILQLYDRIIPNQAMGTLSILAVGVAVAVIMESVLRIARGYVLSWIGQQFDYSTSTSVFSHLMKTNLHDLNKMGIGEHIENIESLVTLKEFLAGQSLLIFLDLPFFLFYLVLIDYFGGKPIVIVSMIILIAFVVISLHMGEKLHKTLLERQDIGDRKYSFLIQMLNNYYTLKSLGMEELFLRRFERIQLQSSFIDYRMNIYSSEARDLGSVFSNILFGAIIYIAGFEVIDTKISPGAMAACLFLSNRLIQPLQQGLSVWTRFQHFKIAQKRFQNVFKIPFESTEGVQKKIKGAITIKDLTFGYEGTNRILFENLNASINAGEFISIIGDSGIGKTTLSQLILGNIQPVSGEIKIDETPLGAINIASFRKQVAYLPPKGEIFKGTVMDNLTFFSPPEKTDHIYSLCRQVGLDRWVSRLPYGYQTNIGVHIDSDLPLGIQQRMCLVRALLLGPQILILDEANTNLDIEGDLEMLSLLSKLKGKITILFITHRPSVSRYADRTFEIKDQKMTERLPNE